MSSKNIYCDFYVYAYIRSQDSETAKAGTPYYIGKGRENRAYKKHGKIPVPEDKKYIIFIYTGLTNTGSLALERRLIKWYGRKNIGTGILLNRTDGGDGATGVSEETRRKISAGQVNRIHTEEERKKNSQRMMGNQYGKGKNLGNKHASVKRSPEFIEKSANGHKKIVKLISPKNQIFYTKELKIVCEHLNLNLNTIKGIMRGHLKRKTNEQGWRCEKVGKQKDFPDLKLHSLEEILNS